jgi:hypothetical protein
MAFDDNLAARICHAPARTKSTDEKTMFGSVGFLLNGYFLVGVWKDSLCVRLGRRRRGTEGAAMIQGHRCRVPV